MRKSNYLIISIVLLILIGSVGGYYFLSGKTWTDPVKAVPRSAILVYKGNQWKELFNSFDAGQFGKLYRDNDAYSGFYRGVAFIDSLVLSEPKLQKLLSVNTYYISLHATGLDQRDLLLSLPSTDIFTIGDVKKLLASNLPTAVINERNFNGEKLYEVSNEGKPVFSFTISEGVFLAGTNVLLVEEGIYSLQNDGHNPVRELLYNSKNGQLVVNYSRGGDLLSAYIAPMYTSVPSSFAKGGWYDMNISDDKLSFHGNLQVEDTANFLWLMKEQKPVSMQAAGYLSSRTSFFISQGFTDFNTYFNRRLQQNTQLQAEVSAFEKSSGISLENDIFPLIGEEIVFAITETPTEDHSSAMLGIVSSPDVESLAGKIISLSTEQTARTYRDHSIHQNNSPIAEILFGTVWGRMEKGYFTMYNNRLYFSSSLDNLQRVLDELLSGQTLSRSVDYVKFSENLLSAGNYFIFVNSNRGQNLPVQYLQSNYVSRYRENYSRLKNFHFTAFQVSNEGNSIYNQLVTQYGSERRENIEMLWRVQLDADMQGKPHVVSNHNNNRNEILLNDEEENLYLVGSGGDILWKRKISGIIEGEVYQVDLYRNNKLQYLFATSSHIYLVDRNGQNVANYPIRLSSGTRGGITLVTSGSQSRYFICGLDNRINGYQLDGRPLAGWNPKVVEEPLAGALKSFKVKGVNYLYGATGQGKLHVWDMNGKQEVKPISLGSRFNNSFIAELSETLSQIKLLSADTAGTIYSVKLDGEIQQITTAGYTTANRFYSLDISGDKSSEFIFTDASKLVVHDRTGKEKTSMTLHDSLPDRAKFFHLNGRYLIGYPARNSGEIYLQTLDGIILDGFPVQGNTRFDITDITGNGSNELITGFNNYLILYKLSN